MKTALKSRKFVQAFLAELALIGALAWCLAHPEALAGQVAYVAGAIVAVAVGYGAANAWQARAFVDAPPPKEDEGA